MPVSDKLFIESAMIEIELASKPKTSLTANSKTFVITPKKEASFPCVDDEQAIADLVEVYLKNENYHVYKFYNSKDALNCIENERLDLAILDVMLPDVDGFSICQQIREKHNFPVIMLTAKEEEIDKITGLTLGADDYITKPFQPLELIARVKAQLRRFTKYNSQEPNQKEHLIAFSGLVLDMDTHECMLNEKSCLSLLRNFLFFGSFVPIAEGWSVRKNCIMTYGETSISPTAIIR